MNLAGREDADRHVRRELEIARINVVEGEPLTGEVPTTLTGELGGITFRRAWYYWVASGPVPISIARRLYDDPCGVTDIRVAGHCGCPAPEAPWTKWLTPDGREVIATQEEERIVHVREMFDNPDIGADYVFSDDPESMAAEYVDTYHIDSEVGLRLFADALAVESVS